MFPNLLERLRGTPARIEDRIKELPLDLLRRQLDGTWSIAQNIGHLVIVETLWFKRLDDFDSGMEVLTEADMSNQATEEADFNNADPQELTAAFRRIRSDFVARLEVMNEEELVRSAHHTRLNQSMRVIDLMQFAAEHDDHHLARITEILNEIRVS